MREFDLWFEDGEEPVLEKTEFRDPGSVDGEKFEAERGKKGKNPNGKSVFEWTPATQASAVLFIDQTIWGMTKGSDVSGKSPVLKGKKREPPYSLSEAITKRYDWLRGMFGADKTGNLLINSLLRLHKNRQCKQPGPVMLALEPLELAPQRIRIFIDGKHCEDKERLRQLRDRIQDGWVPKGNDSIEGAAVSAMAASPQTASSTARHTTAPPETSQPQPVNPDLLQKVKVTIPGVEMEVIINRPFHSYKKEDQERFLAALRDLHHLTTVMAIAPPEPGSVRLKLRMSPEDAERLKQLFREGRLADFDVIAVRLESTPPLSIPEPARPGSQRHRNPTLRPVQQPLETIASQHLKPVDVQQIFTKAGRGWTLAERQKVMEWLCESPQLRHLLLLAQDSLGRGATLGDAEEVWNEFFVKRLGRVIDLYDPGKRGMVSFWNYLRFCFRRFCWDRTEKHLLGHQQLMPKPALELSTEEIVLQVERREAVVRAIEALAEPYRTALILKAIEGLPLKEVATRLGRKYQTAANLVHRAKKKLGAWLEQHYPELL